MPSTSTSPATPAELIAAIVTALALGVSPEAEATTTALIALHRTIIVPLKSYGMVAGRLTRDDSHGASLSREQRMRVCATTVAYVVVPIGILFLLAPQVPASVLGAAGDAPGGRFR